MKYLYLTVLLCTVIFFSCEEKYKELSPASNRDSIKVKLELSEVKSSGGKAEFSIRLINTGERDLARCTLNLDNKYRHQLEGVIHKTPDWEGKPETSIIKMGESATIEFRKDNDNYNIFGIKDDNFTLPETIELICLDGSVIWKTK